MAIAHICKNSLLILNPSKRYWGQIYVNVGSMCVCVCMQTCACLYVCQCACICMQRGHRSVMGIIPLELFLWGRVFLWYLGLSIWLGVLDGAPGIHSSSPSHIWVYNYRSPNLAFHMVSGTRTLQCLSDECVANWTFSQIKISLN